MEIVFVLKLPITYFYNSVFLEAIYKKVVIKLDASRNIEQDYNSYLHVLFFNWILGLEVKLIYTTRQCAKNQ